MTGHVSLTLSWLSIIRHVRGTSCLLYTHTVALIICCCIPHTWLVTHATIFQSDSSPVMSKKLINHADSVVDEALSGMVAVYPGLRKLESHRVIVRADIQSVVKKGKVITEHSFL